MAKILIITGDGGEAYETWFAVHRFQEARLPFRRDCEVHRDEDRSDERVPADQKVNSGHLGDA